MMANQSLIKERLPITLAIAIFMQMLDSTVLNTALPAIAQDLHQSAINMHYAIVSYVLTLAVLMPVSGFLADRFGTRKIFLLALVVFSVGSLLCALSQTLMHLIIARIIQGAGGSLLTPVGKLALIKTFNSKEMVQAMNFAIVSALIGPVMGPLVGGYVSVYLSWHWIFLINIPIGVLGIVLALNYMPDYRSESPKFDLRGFLYFSLASLLLSLSIELLGDIQNLTLVLTIFIIGILLFVLYFAYARRSANPLFPLNLFMVRTFRVGILGNFATRLGISAVPLLLPLMIQTIYGQSAIVSGWMLAPMALMAIFAKSRVINILSRFGYRNTLVVNTTIIGLLICALAIPGIHTNLYWFVPIIFSLGFFNSIQFTSMNSIALADLRQHHTSSGNSLLAVNQQLAIGFGISTGLVVLKYFQFNTTLTHNNAHNAFRYTFVVMGLISILASLVFRRLHPSDGTNLQ
ncbi:DHA2 family efflux MFS transporter permease subunit [Emticicia sp. 21SJ11W-3]|uniref:DHA2 family efflux MFS transporter permease subunit n=1 Tax=Emticicia sp. 21SJ11W-3 TaxID=2916755 RepID=UPI0020A0D009|nr:DHA2 family efflux MFS transporter permease subunit [Emticicia sp. 21SJ11W-3]UTA66603.1 DHA2 family efflux MFS transporter permease subunit [Emticicia sp. 21SJ11W-3]